MAAIISANKDGQDAMPKNDVPGAGVYEYGAIQGQCVLPKYQNDTSQAASTSSIDFNHCIKPALIVWSLATGKIVHIVSHNGDDDAIFDSDVERCLADIKEKYDRSVYPMIFDSKDDFIIPGLIDINNTVCDVELGLTKTSLGKRVQELHRWRCNDGGGLTQDDSPLRHFWCRAKLSVALRKTRVHATEH